MPSYGDTFAGNNNNNLQKDARKILTRLKQPPYSAHAVCQTWIDRPLYSRLGRTDVGYAGRGRLLRFFYSEGSMIILKCIISWFKNKWSNIIFQCYSRTYCSALLQCVRCKCCAICKENSMFNTLLRAYFIIKTISKPHIYQYIIIHEQLTVFFHAYSYWAK